MAQIHQEDWHNIGLQEEIYFSPEFKEYSFTFTASGVVEKNNRISFAVGIEKGSVFVKNMSLKQKRL